MKEKDELYATSVLIKTQGEVANGRPLPVVAGKAVDLFADEVMRERGYNGEGGQIDESTVDVVGLPADLKNVREGDPVILRNREWTVQLRSDNPGSIALVLKSASNF